MRRRCPGECGRYVKPPYYCCLICWRRLPRTIRLGIAHQDRTVYRSASEAGRAASHWFQHHPIKRRLRVGGAAV